MSEVRPLVDAGAVGFALALIAGAGFLAAAVLAVLARSNRKLRPVVFAGGVAALLFPAWWVYNRIEDALGLDSVAALLINLIGFVILGVALGIGWRVYCGPPSNPVSDPGLEAALQE